MLFLAFAVALLLLSEITEKETTSGAALLFTIRKRPSRKATLLIFWLAMLLFRLTHLSRTVRTTPRYLLSVMIAGRVAGLLCSASFMQP